MNEVLRKLSLLLFFTFFIGNLSISAAQKNNNPLFLQQNLNVLTDRNGEIVEQNHIIVDSEFSDKIDCYKIRYLSDGLEVVGFIFKPKNFDSNLPVLIFNRGGNREYGKISGVWLKYLSFLASNKYVVLASQYRGNDGGQGREQFGGSDVNDVLDLIPLSKSLRFTDPNNIFMLGVSRGGMMTYLAIKYGAPINAAAVVGGVTDLWGAYVQRRDMNFLTQLVGLEKKDFYKRSAIHWPEQINVPILILHGAKDNKVSVKQAKKLANKLDELGKEYELNIFPKGNHSLGNYKTERNAKIFEWFDKHKKQPITDKEIEGTQVKIETKIQEVPKAVVKDSPQKQHTNLGALKTQESRGESRDGRFIEYKDGTLFDTETNLMWWSEGIEVEDIQNAIFKSRYFKGGGYSDWRVPTIDELKTLYNESSKKKYKSINLITLTTPYLLSSDYNNSVGEADYIKYLNFKNGREGNYLAYKLNDAPGRMVILPVRKKSY